MTGASLQSKSASREAVSDAALADKISNFSMSGTLPFVGFGTVDFTAIAHEGLRSLLSNLDDAVEVGINPQPLRAAIAGLELLVALAALNESCRPYEGGAK